jgi:hypothetical protein
MEFPKSIHKAAMTERMARREAAESLPDYPTIQE